MREPTRMKSIKELMPVASRPPSVQVDGVDVAGHLRDKKNHNLVEQDLEFDTYIVYQHDGTRTSSTTAPYLTDTGMLWYRYGKRIDGEGLPKSGGRWSGLGTAVGTGDNDNRRTLA